MLNNSPIVRHLELYTDGAQSSKTEMGGWACICIEGDEILDHARGHEPYTTNNRMELMGFLCALEMVDQVDSSNVKIEIFTDSAYVANSINLKWYQNWLRNGWKTADRQNVKNQDLWTRIIALYIKLKAKFHDFSIVKVKSHSGNKWNSYADLLAVKSRKELED